MKRASYSCCKFLCLVSLLLLTWSIAGVACRACHSSGTFFFHCDTHTHANANTANCAQYFTLWTNSHSFLGVHLGQSLPGDYKKAQFVSQCLRFDLPLIDSLLSTHDHKLERFAFFLENAFSHAENAESIKNSFQMYKSTKTIFFDLSLPVLATCPYSRPPVSARSRKQLETAGLYMPSSSQYISKHFSQMSIGHYKYVHVCGLAEIASGRFYCSRSKRENKRNWVPGHDCKLAAKIHKISSWNFLIFVRFQKDKGRI